MKKILVLPIQIVALGLLTLVSACSTEPPKPDPGRCFSNTDCRKGEKCNDTRCEDIYHPRRTIKIN
jgi:hypothetical protein